MRRITIASTLVLILTGPALVIANGPGHGLGHALGKMGGQAKGTSGINKATDRLGKTGLNRAPGLNRASGLTRGPLAKGPQGTPARDVDMAGDNAARHQRQLAIEQRNRDHRLEQAQKLRELGERNGNEELLDNADRMEAAAHEHYQARVEHLERFGVVDPLLNPPANPPDSGVSENGTSDAIGTADVAEPQTAARPWWKPKWLGNR